MPDFKARCTVLERENENLRERIIELEEALGVNFDAPPWLGLTGREAQLFGLFISRDAVTKALVMSQIYGNSADEPAEEKIVDVFVCKLRAKLKPFGIEIGTNWGQGYFMPAAMKDKFRALNEQRAAA